MNSFIDMFTFNKTFFSGGMDMIVVRHPDGTLKSTPLRIRFGQFKILRAKEKKVQMIVNGKDVELPMKLSENGVVYLLKESTKSKKKEFNDDSASNLSDNSISSIPKGTENSPRNDKDLSFNLEDDSTQELANDLDPMINTRKNGIYREINFTINKTRKATFPLSDSNDNINIRDILNSPITSSPINTSQEQSPLINAFNNFGIELSYSWDIIRRNKNDKNFNVNEHFNKNKISNDVFVKDPWKVLNNANLAIKYEKHIYTWKVIAPMLICLLAYNTPLPEESLHNLTQQENGFLMWKKIEKNAYKINIEKPNTIPIVPKEKIQGKKFRKSYTFTSEHLQLLGLHPGRNEAIYRVSTGNQGNQEISSEIYLWEWNDKILVSDLDGTVTRSDVIGQLFALWGKDWTHKRVVKLYNHINNNGYKILYLTARSMCYHTQTKNLLYSITQDELGLPRGPILMSWDGLVNSLKREIIDRTPDRVKIECLTWVVNLFPGDVFPFYCGIGNKKTDAIAYEAVGISKDKIFIINERGEVSTSNTNYKLTYEKMDEKLDHLFPYANDNGYNSLFYDNKTINYYAPNISKMIGDDFENELKDLLN